MIQLTEKAAREVRELISGQNMPEGTFLRLGVAGGGCSGFTYNLRFDTEMKPDDQTEEQFGVKVVCDPKSFVYLEGSEVDFSDGLNGRGFVFRNPNASTTCGCGESFGV
jgi:iron-sulfur cluster assembly protein